MKCQKKSSAMEIIETPARKSASATHQSHWLQTTISGVDEKMKAILNALEDHDSPLQNAEIYERRKETITKMVQDLCISYRSLAEKYDLLKSLSIHALDSRTSSPSNYGKSKLNDMKHEEVSRRWDDTQLEAINSNPESSVEDADIEYVGDILDFEHLKTFVHNLVLKDDISIKPENTWSDGVKSDMSKLVEENRELLIELIRRNTEKTETIIKLQEQVSRLMDKHNALQRCLSYYERNKQLQVESPRRKTLDKFFRGCS